MISYPPPPPPDRYPDMLFSSSLWSTEAGNPGEMRLVVAEFGNGMEELQLALLSTRQSAQREKEKRAKNREREREYRELAELLNGKTTLEKIPGTPDGRDTLRTKCRYCSKRVAFHLQTNVGRTVNTLRIAFIFKLPLKVFFYFLHEIPKRQNAYLSHKILKMALEWTTWQS